MNINELTSCFKALGDDTRSEIVEMLKSGTMCACKILERFSLTQSTLSYHMKQLTDCGLVSVEKDWKWSYYSLNLVAFEQLRNYFDFDISTKSNFKCEEE